MSRPLRLEFPGALWHVTSRGNQRREIFRDAGDRQRFLEILARVIDLYRWRLHAYVLMGNHYHLLFETPEPTLSRGMRQLNGVYTQAFHRRHRTGGHLLQGRFKAILVEKEAHLLELARYVVLNPVRAGIATSARNWPWSSFRATAGLGRAPAWLEIEWTLSQFGRTPAEAAKRYLQFVAEGRGATYEPWKQLHGQIYLGSDEFLETAEHRVPTGPAARGIPKRQLRPTERDARSLFTLCIEALGRDPDELRHRSRKLAAERQAIAHVLRRHGLRRHREIGDVLGVGEAQASVLAAGGEKALATDPVLRRKLLAALRVPRAP